jgi:hypothetical protein
MVAGTQRDRDGEVRGVRRTGDAGVSPLRRQRFGAGSGRVVLAVRSGAEEARLTEALAEVDARMVTA